MNNEREAAIAGAQLKAHLEHETGKRLALTKPADVADLFVQTCERLRKLGATRVEAFGLFAAFGPVQPPVSAAREPRKETPPPPQLGEDARELQERAQELASGRL